MARCKRQVKAKRNLTCSSCDSCIDFAKSGCANSWAEVQADDFHFVCRGCKTVKCLQEQVNELRHMMTGQGEKEESRGGENDESRGGETEESREDENEESRGIENEESRGGENNKSSGNVREKAGKKKKFKITGDRVCNRKGKCVSGEGVPGGKIVKVDDRRERGHNVRQERSFADVVSQGKVRKARVFMGDSIIRKLDKIVNREDDITVCLPGANIEDITAKAGHVMGGGTGGGVLVHVGTNNAEEGTSAIVGKYRRSIKTLKEARVGQIVLSGILPIMGGRGEEYRNCRRMAINTQVQKVCMEKGVGFVDMWLNFVGRVFHERWTSSHREGCCSSWVRVCQSCRRGHRYHKLFKLDAQGELTEKTQRSTTTNTHPNKCSPIISDNELKCVCLNARSIVNKKK